MTDEQVVAKLMAKVRQPVSFSYPAGEGKKEGVLTARVAVKSSGATSSGARFWNVIDLLTFKGERHPWIRLCYYRLDGDRLTFSRGALTDTKDDLHALFAVAAKEDWFREVVTELVADPSVPGSRTMTENEAQQIAALINRRNHLAKQYLAADVLREAFHYEFEVRDGSLAACVERKRVQWYQWEICHLSVDEAWEGQGVAFAVYSRAEAAARSGGACLLQCTIRAGNEDSEKFFLRQGFTKVGSFHYVATGNDVGMWHKVLIGPKDEKARGE